MSEKYLDVKRSVIISSPAGSGKTEKLARRYIGLLKDGEDVRKILSITFTEKAAAEMKQRILETLKSEDPSVYERIRPDIPLMRIHTIHAFCLKLLKRFSMELGLDPSLSVMEEHTARNLWTEAIYESLMAEKDRPSDFFHVMREGRLGGWSALRRALDEFYAKRPYPEMFMGQGAVPGGEGRGVLRIYGECLKRYGEKKARKRVIDFTDIEMLAFKALSTSPEWHNVLFSFDEHTDHVLVDEFQDTSTLQWKIIDKLTEEWRSGMGAKRESGGTPTIFLVGDEKQSIYMFRGANVGVFREAMQRFSEWLGGEYHFIEARENYRSLPAIVEFTNRLFERLMPGNLISGWMTRYSPFEAVREGEGNVDLVLLEAPESTRDARRKEARVLAARIRAMHGRHEVFEGDENPRPCRYGDMAVLLRKRTHLSAFEDALREENIPFVVMKGIGFYEEPETALLRELVCFIVDPEDDYGLFCLLRSPLFSVDYKTLSSLLRGKKPLVEKLRSARGRRLKWISGTIDRWLAMSRDVAMPVLIEQVLLDTRGWTHFHEGQRHANIKKFIALVESLEAEGLSPLEIREKLLRQKGAGAVSKANVNAEGMDAVKIMTIHASKGLQFPMVFLPSMEERISPQMGPVTIDEAEDGSIVLGYEEDPGERRKNEHARRMKLKGLEEEKRLFYVAVTRARDYLCMLGSIKGEKATGRLEYLSEAFGSLEGEGVPFRVLGEEDISGEGRYAALKLHDTAHFMDEPSYAEPLAYAPSRVWRDVTGSTEKGVRHAEKGAAMGRVMHTLLEELSRGFLLEDGMEKRAAHLLRAEAVREKAVLEGIMEDLGKLKTSGFLDEIVLPREGSHAELPFVLEKDGHVYKGRIDRLIIRGDTAMLYDYKTFPVRRGEIPALKEKYGPQMRIYGEAVERLFGLRTEAYLVFTHSPLVTPV
jgi:ATP-dependent helicase/nuclease subunit A